MEEFASAITHAQSNHSEGDSSLFSTALGFLQNRSSSHQSSEDSDVDEDEVLRAHKSLYGGADGVQAEHDYQGGGQEHDSKSLGSGAALQALKMFTSGSGGSGGSGGMDKNEFIGMAMAQAGKLFDAKSASGGVSGDKQTAINHAAEMAFKMYMKSQGGGLGGTGGAGGAGGLMSLASKFL